MNVEIGTEAAQFPEKEYGTFVAVYSNNESNSYFRLKLKTNKNTDYLQ